MAHSSPTKGLCCLAARPKKGSTSSSRNAAGASAMRMRRLGSRGSRRITLVVDSIELGGAGLHCKH